MRLYRAFVAGLFALCVVSLSACGGGGDSSPTELPGQVVIAAPETAEVGAELQFSSDLTDASADLSWQWDFGDGTTSTGAIASHRYIAPGDYDVVLVVRNSEGESVSSHRTVRVRRAAMVQGATCSAGEGRGWCWQRPLPMGNQINDIYFQGPLVGWAVGESGQILKTTDAGQTWTAQMSPVTETLTQVRFADEMSGWAVGASATVLKTFNGGASWTRQAVLPPGDAGSGDQYAITVIDAQRAVLRSSSMVIGGTRDGGETWSLVDGWYDLVTEGGTAWRHEYNTIEKWPLGADRGQPVFDAGSGRGIPLFSMGSELHGLMVVQDWGTGATTWMRTSNGGRSWPSFSPAGLPERPDWLQSTSATVAWARTYTNIFRSTDAGSSWQAVALPADAWNLSTLVVSDDQTAWFQHEAGFYLTTDGGASWTLLQVTGETAYTERTLWAQGGKHWIRHADRIHVSSDLGAHWRQVLGGDAVESHVDLTAVWFFDGQRGLALSGGEWLLETTDGGRSWSRRSLTDGAGSGRFQFVSAEVGWLSRASGISKTSDGGKTWWQPLTDLDMSNITDFHFVDDQLGWALTASGVVRTLDGGGTWQHVYSADHWMRGVRFIDAQVGVMVGSYGAVLRTTDGGETWTVRPSGVPNHLMKVTFVDALNGWAVGEGGVMIRTTDAGLSWSRVPVPLPLQSPAYTVLQDVLFADPLHGWAVGSAGVVLATADGGETWSWQASGTVRTLNSVFALDPYTAWVVGAGGAVLSTATAGE